MLDRPDLLRSQRTAWGLWLACVLSLAALWALYSAFGPTWTRQLYEPGTPETLSQLALYFTPSPEELYRRQGRVAFVLLSALILLSVWWVCSWGRFGIITRRLTVVALVHIVLIQGLLFITTPQRWRDPGIRHTARFFSMREADDSWYPMNLAYDYALSQGSTPMYTEIFFDRKVKFQYPPTSLLFLPILRNLRPSNPVRGMIEGPARYLSWSFLWISVVCSLALLFIRFQASDGRWRLESSFHDRVAISLLVLCLGLTFYPATKSYALGQIQTWINGLLAAVVLLWTTRRELVAGALTGLVCLIKPTYALLLIWALLRRRWSFVAAAASVGFAGVVASLWLFGWQNHLDYLRVVEYIAQRGEGYYPNQSMNGLLNRLLHNGNNMDWRADAFVPYHPWVHAGTVASSLALVGGLLLWALRCQTEPGVIELCLAILTTTIASPIAWEHHYGVLLPIYAVLLPAVLGQASGRAQARRWLTVSFLLTASFIVPAKFTAGYPVLNLVQSYLYIGALISLVLLYRVLPDHPRGDRDAENARSRDSDPSFAAGEMPLRPWRGCSCRQNEVEEPEG
jgi:hypothetical protein